MERSPSLPNEKVVFALHSIEIKTGARKRLSFNFQGEKYCQAFNGINVSDELFLTITDWPRVMKKWGFGISVVTFIWTCRSLRIAVISVIGAGSSRPWTGASTGTGPTVGGRFQPCHFIVFWGGVTLAWAWSLLASESASRSHLKGVHTQWVLCIKANPIGTLTNLGWPSVK